MPVANPRKKTASKETKAKAFIHQSPNSNGGASTPKRELRDVLIGFDRALLERIDRAAQNMGLSRTAFVVSSTAKAVMIFEKEFLEAQG